MKTEVDSHRLSFHPERVAEWVRKGDCFPIYVEVGPTNSCNHRCIFCALDYLEKGGFSINRDVMVAALKDMAENGVKSVMFAGEGEPLLHKDICEFVIEAKNLGLDISITTNGVLLDRQKAEKIIPGLSWIRFSLDAGTKENYGKIHGTREEDFPKVISNIKNSVRIKKELGLNTTIGVQLLLIPNNIKESLNAARIIKEIGADNIQIKPYSHHPSSKNDFSVDYSNLDWLESELKKLGDKTFQVSFRKNTMQRIEDGRDYNECFGLPFFTLIDAKGNVIPCNLFYNLPEFYYGNLNEKSFSEIWKSEQRKKVIEKIKETKLSSCRAGCRLDPANKYLKQLKNPHPHVNFI